MKHFFDVLFEQNIQTKQFVKQYSQIVLYKKAKFLNVFVHMNEMDC
jgi:hypothetical protein